MRRSKRSRPASPAGRSERTRAGRHRRAARGPPVGLLTDVHNSRGLAAPACRRRCGVPADDATRPRRRASDVRAGRRAAPGADRPCRSRPRATTSRPHHRRERGYLRAELLDVVRPGPIASHRPAPRSNTAALRWQHIAPRATVQEGSSPSSSRLGGLRDVDVHPSWPYRRLRPSRARDARCRRPAPGLPRALARARGVAACPITRPAWSSTSTAAWRTPAQGRRRHHRRRRAVVLVAPPSSPCRPTSPPPKPSCGARDGPGAVLVHGGPHDRGRPTSGSSWSRGSRSKPPPTSSRR